MSVSNGAHILFGGFPKLLLEACSKMRGIFESDIIGDFRYILIALAEQLAVDNLFALTVYGPVKEDDIKDSCKLLQ